MQKLLISGLAMNYEIYYLFLDKRGLAQAMSVAKVVGGTRFVVALAFFLFTYTSLGFAAETGFLQKELLTPDFIRTLTWKTDAQLARIIEEWPAYTDKQGFEDRIVLNQTEALIMGIKFGVEYRELKSNSIGEILFLRKDKYGKDFCASFMKWGTEQYGKPHKVLDVSSVPNKEGSFFENLWADWEIGQTRIKLACSGVAIYGSYIPGIALVSYRQKDQEKALEELIYIECSRTSRDFGPLSKGTIEQQPPIILIVDPNERILRRQNKSPFLKTHKFTDDEILASEEDEKFSQEIRIDRTTGNYEWKSRIKPDVRNGVDQWGKCSPYIAKKQF